MAILSGKRREGPSSGHEFDRISEKLYGGSRGKVNRMKDLFTSDYIYVYKDNDDDVYDNEIGINKNYLRIHDSDWCNGEKNEHHALNRFFNSLDDSGETISGIINDDGSVNFENLEEFLFEDGDSNE